MNIEEDNNQKGNLNSPTQEAKTVVELNSYIIKTIQILQVDLQSFRDDNLKEIKEQQAINEALLQNMMRGSPQGKPIYSTNRFKK